MTKLSAEVMQEVPFHDVDVMEVVWHGYYVKYFELARCALLRRIDYDYSQMRASGYAWPVVECYLKYVRPARYGQRLVVRSRLREYENRLKIDYEITDAESGERLTKGFTVQVAVDLGSGELQFVSPPCLIKQVEKLCAV
jgi:acyl-CoA thioester hydrolase